MNIKFFGQYLLDRGAVSVEQLLKAVELQESVNLKFGQTALALKLFSESDLTRIHEAQRSEDLKFGDLAQKLGILDQAQVGQILVQQQRYHLRIGDALVRTGALDAEELPGLLEEFRNSQALYSTSQTEIPRGVLHPEIWEFCADLSAKMFLRVAGVECRVGECSLVERVPAAPLVAAVVLAGSVSATYHLGVSQQVRDRIARALLMADDLEGESLELLEDTVLEFANVVCGNVAAKACQYGKEVEILPPFALKPGSEGVAVPAQSHGLFFPLHLADGGRAELTIFVKR